MPEALVVVDFQHEWLNPDSPYYVSDLKEEIKKANKVIDFCRAKGDVIVFTRHIESGGGAFAPDKKESELLDELHVEKDDIIIKKNRISPFYMTDLDEKLKGITDVAVIGILANMCVRSFVEDAYDRDYNVTVIMDLCIAYDEETREFTFKDLKATRPEVNFLTFDEFHKHK